MASCMGRYRTARRVRFDDTHVASRGVHKKPRASSSDKAQRVYRKTPQDANNNAVNNNAVPLAPLRDTHNPDLSDAERHALQQQQRLAESIWQEMATIHENTHGGSVSPEIMSIYEDADEHSYDTLQQGDHGNHVGLETELATLQQYDRHAQYVMTIYDIDSQLHHAECITSISDIDLYFMHNGKKNDT
jgi:hypothetical protein